jgi:hypothetical protein
LTASRDICKLKGIRGDETAVKGNSDVKHVGCFAHAKQKYHEASKGSKKPDNAIE